VTDIDRHLENMHRDGFSIIENAFSEEFCDQAVAAFRRAATARALSIAPGSPPGMRTLRVDALIQYDDLFQEVALHQTVLAIMENYLDKEPLLSGIDGIEIHPGEVEQPLHTDTWWHDDRRFDFPICVNTALALCDFTSENGATHLVPGSHLWSAEQVAGMGFFRSPDVKPQGFGTEWEPLVMTVPKGTMFLWDSRVLHGGRANTGTTPRPSIISPYIVGWCRQLDNFAFTIPPEKARTFPERLQQLIGLDVYRGAYGHVQFKSPKDFLWGNKPPGRALDPTAEVRHL